MFEGTLASFVLLLAGIALLYFGGEYLVDGASSLARTFGLSPMVIGLTVVAFGTSAPELAASLTAAIKGAPEIALANVVGSNIANLALVLPVAALIFPMVMEADLRLRVPVDADGPIRTHSSAPAVGSAAGPPGTPLRCPEGGETPH